MSLLGVLFAVPQSFARVSSSLASIDFDATLEEGHDWKNDVTKNPVEIGSDVTDNIRNQPDEFSITGFISNDPLSYEYELYQASQLYEKATLLYQTGSTSGASASYARVQSAVDILRTMIQSGELMTVYTRYVNYTSMALESISLPRSPSAGEAIQVTMKFVKVVMVSSKTTNVPAGITKKSTTSTSTGIKSQATKANGAVQTKQFDMSTGPITSFVQSGAAAKLSSGVTSFVTGLLK